MNDDEAVKDDVVSVRLPRTLKRKARAKAALEGRTISVVIIEGLTKYVEDLHLEDQ